MLKSIKVRDCMTRHLVTFRSDTDLLLAIERLLEHRISGAPVVDSQGHLIGMLSEGDCLRGILSCTHDEAAIGSVSGCMSAQLETVSPDADIVDVCQRFLRDKRQRFPVVEEGVLIGQVSRRDVLLAVKGFARHDPEQPPEV
ncbi:CBS domain-containing protein [Metapseudomonas resinovorans]|uniref:CBS domain-containing protein n=1 Tax=Metapseudomonas resinovorans TaxID=53412 RepID=UPI000986AB01|nr:CBS domain-containing protein [Pseudomonas resinovorans]GLZ85746.1 CBS domain-containing protein [Pseudomonas resinovorans]